MVDQDGFCTECGAVASSTDKFCAGCGHNLGGSVPVSSAPPKPKAPPVYKEPQKDFGIPKWGWRVIFSTLAVCGIALWAWANSASETSNDPGPDSVPATTQALWLGYYDWDLKENVDAWTTNCQDIQDHFDYIYEIRDGLRRKYGQGGSQIMDYLHQIGKEMGCEAFQF